jgi:hypothetical protein
MKQLLSYAAGVLVSAIVPALLISLSFSILSFSSENITSILRQLPFIFLIVFLVAFAHAIFLGFPIYLIVNKYFRFTYLSAVVCGFFVGALPLAIYTWPIEYNHMNSSSSINGVQTFINGVPTISGWLLYLRGVLLFSMFGIAGAISFKYVLAKMGKL